MNAIEAPAGLTTLDGGCFSRPEAVFADLTGVTKMPPRQSV